MNDSPHCSARLLTPQNYESCSFMVAALVARCDFSQILVAKFIYINPSIITSLWLYLFSSSCKESFFGCFSHQYLTTVFFKNQNMSIDYEKLQPLTSALCRQKKKAKFYRFVVNDTSIIHIYKCVLVEFSRESKR